MTQENGGWDEAGGEAGGVLTTATIPTYRQTEPARRLQV
jgi:hypothetical protein